MWRTPGGGSPTAMLRASSDSGARGQGAAHPAEAVRSAGGAAKASSRTVA